VSVVRPSSINTSQEYLKRLKANLTEMLVPIDNQTWLPRSIKVSDWALNYLTTKLSVMFLGCAQPNVSFLCQLEIQDFATTEQYFSIEHNGKTDIFLSEIMVF